MLEGAVERFFGLHRQIVDGAAFNLDPAIPNGPRAVVVPAREGQIQSRHAGHRAPAAAGSTTADL